MLTAGTSGGRRISMKILVTGSAGFICGYLVEELLEHGHEVIGIDNFSKYGKVEKSYDSHPNYHFVEGDAKNTGLMKELISDCDQVLASAAMIGGISYFHHYAYDLLAENDRITNNNNPRTNQRGKIFSALYALNDSKFLYIGYGHISALITSSAASHFERILSMRGTISFTSESERSRAFIPDNFCLRESSSPAS